MPGSKTSRARVSTCWKCGASFGYVGFRKRCVCDHCHFMAAGTRDGRFTGVSMRGRCFVKPVIRAATFSDGEIRQIVEAAIRNGWIATTLAGCAKAGAIQLCPEYTTGNQANSQ